MKMKFRSFQCLGECKKLISIGHPLINTMTVEECPDCEGNLEELTQKEYLYCESMINCKLLEKTGKVAKNTPQALAFAVSITREVV